MSGAGDGGYGFKLVDETNVLIPDDVFKALVTIDEDGPRPVAPADTMQALQEVRLEKSVPLNVRRAFQMALGAMAYAYWYYPLLTLAAQQILRVADFASDIFARERGMDLQYSLAARLKALAKDGAVDELQLRRWEGIRRLRNSATHPSFQQIWGPAQAIDVARAVADAINTLPWASSPQDRPNQEA